MTIRTSKFSLSIIMSTKSNIEIKETTKPEIEVLNPDSDQKNADSSSKSSSKSFNKSNTKAYLDSFTRFLEEWLIDKAPKLPHELTNWIVKYLPLINIIGMVLSAIGILTTIKILIDVYNPTRLIPGSVTDIGYYGFSQTISYWATFTIIVSIAVSIAQIYFNYKAQPSLEPKKYEGWKNLYYATLVGFASQFLTLNGFGIVLYIIPFYFLFQIKNNYKRVL